MGTESGLLSACGVVAIAGLVFIGGASAAENRKDEPLKMDAPMSGEMKKKGMKQGDVKKREEQWDRKMKEMIGKEEKTMDPGNAKK
ncbi:MAG: hypothetical protein QOK44_941 [Betaproteobacteria bacterium]|nr:hypothetical protein [Betaproteobacteria bacterium]